MDNLLNFYRHENNEEEKQLLHAFITHTQLHQPFSLPYITVLPRHPCLNILSTDYHHGITVTCPGFYGPQGRVFGWGLSILI